MLGHCCPGGNWPIQLSLEPSQLFARSDSSTEWIFSACLAHPHFLSQGIRAMNTVSRSVVLTRPGRPISRSIACAMKKWRRFAVDLPFSLSALTADVASARITSTSVSRQHQFPSISSLTLPCLHNFSPTPVTCENGGLQKAPLQTPVDPRERLRFSSFFLTRENTGNTLEQGMGRYLVEGTMLSVLVPGTLTLLCTPQQKIKR